MRHFVNYTRSYRRLVFLLSVAVCLLVAIPDMAASASLGTTYVRLSWTAPGDDIYVGQASQYDIRYSETPITNDDDFDNATQDTQVPLPLPSGSTQLATVGGLEPGVHYYFAVKTADDVPNWSALSNVFEATTLTAADNGSGTVFISDISVDDVTAASAVISWETDVPALSEVVYGIGGLTFATEKSTQLATFHSVTLSDLAPTAEYQFRVICDDGQGNLTQSDIVSFVTTAIGAATVASAAGIIAYPNPVRFSLGEFVTFTLPDYPVDLLIQTVSGETVLIKTRISGDWQWDGQNASGHTVATNTYLWFVRGTDQSGKIVVKP